MSEITPNTPNPVREDAYVEELAEKLGIDPQYIPKSPVWRNEEEIAALAEMFANMSGGSSGGGVLVVHNVDGTLDKTWQEIVNAMASGGAACVFGSSENIKGVQVIPNAYYNEGAAHPYIVQIGMLTFTSETANGYPMAE